MFQKCPIYDSLNACDTQNCLFLRSGGCAIVLAAILAEENNKKLADISSRLADIEYTLDLIRRKIDIIG